MYDAVAGRFVSQDPIGLAAGDANLYRYVGNLPTQSRDPSGFGTFQQIELGGSDIERWSWLSGKANEEIGVYDAKANILKRMIGSTQEDYCIVGLPALLQLPSQVIDLDDWDFENWDSWFLRVGAPCEDISPPKPAPPNKDAPILPPATICLPCDEHGLPQCGPLQAGMIPCYCFPGANQLEMHPIGEAISLLGVAVVAATLSGPITRSLSAAEKEAFRAAAREAWECATGKKASPDFDLHHRIPLEWAHLFPKRNPNDPSNVVGVPPPIHHLINAVWTGFRNHWKGKTPTAADVERQAKQIDEEFGQFFQRHPEGCNL